MIGAQAICPRADRHLRPWGSYVIIPLGPESDVQIKELILNPHSATSLQSHKFRSETWFILEGSARITKGFEVSYLCKYETVFIPVGARHRIENTTAKPLVILEIQTGTYFGEDDITRYADMYGRV